MEQLKLSVKEQLALFNLPNAADVFLEYANMSREVYNAIQLLSRDERPKKHKASEAEREFSSLFMSAFSAPENNNMEVLNMLLNTLTHDDCDIINSNWGHICKEAQMKFFEVFPKDVIKNIIIAYCNDMWSICEEAQMKLLEVFSAEEAKEILLNTKIKLSDKAMMFVYENFPKAEAIEILANNAHINKDIMQKILARPDAKDYLVEFLRRGGEFTAALFDVMEKDVDGPQMQIIKHFSEADATEILLMIMQPDSGLEDAIGDGLSEPAMNKILDDFSKENAKKLLLTYIDEHDGYIWPETLSRFIDVFSKEDAKELLLAYMKNDAEYETDLQKKILISFSKDDAKELLLADIKNGESFDDDVLLRIIDMMPSADAKELISTYMPGEELGDEVILNIMAGMDKEDAKELLRQYKREGGKLCKEAQLFLGRK